MEIDVSIINLLRTDIIPIRNFKYKGIQFASKITNDKKSLVDRVFKDEKINTDTLLKSKVENGVLIMETLAMPKNTSVRNFMYMSAFALNVSIAAIHIESKFIPKYKKLQVNDYLDNFSIGNSELTIDIKDQREIKNLGYENIFYQQYISSIYYFNKLNSWKSVVYPTIETIDIVCVKNAKINTPKLFNINVVSNSIKKILIHSTKLDIFLGNYRKFQYVKTSNYVQNGFVNTVSNYETTTFYVNMWDNQTLRLNRVEVSENGVIKFCFTVFDTSEYYGVIYDMLNQFIEDGMIDKILDRIQLSECILMEQVPDFDLVFIGNITASVVIQGLNGDNFEDISHTINQNIPWLHYKTNTSISVGFFTEMSNTSAINYYQSLNSHEYITKQIVQKFILETVHILLVEDKSTIITIHDIGSMDEFKWIMELVCGIFKKPTEEQINYKTDKSIEAIKNKYQNIPSKKLLKTLYDADNIIFGPRKIKDSYRPYSSLAQKDKQRVVIVSEDEYKILSKAQPESCVDIQSQQNHDERIKLFCPFDDYRYLNFRYLTNQVCFPKCTNNFTNKTQYQFCANQLSTYSSSELDTKFENKGITLYNSLISVNRKCKPPIEIMNILIDHYLLKIDTANIVDYCLTKYKLQPFIIKRDIKRELYMVLSDYDDTIDYMLVLQSESDEKYFLCLSMKNDLPFQFSKNKEFKQFIDVVMDNVKLGTIFINYINNLLGIHVVFDKSVITLFNELAKKHKISFVVNDKIVKGIIKNNTFYSTPEILINHSRHSYSILNYKLVLLSIANGSIKLPEFKSIPKDSIQKLMIDYNTNSVCSIKWLGVNMFIKPIVLEMHNYPFEYYDFTGMLNYKIATDNDKVFNTYKFTNIEIKQILDTWLFIYCSSHKDLDIDDFVKFLTANVKVEDIHKIKHLNNQYYISWRNTSIIQDDIDRYIEFLKESNKDDILYSFSNLINDDLVFKYNHIKEVIQSKIITGGG